jgi:hypothetical protein
MSALDVGLRITNGMGSWLDLHDGINYKVKAAPNLGAIQWRKEFVTHRLVPGRRLTSATRDSQEVTFVVEVIGDTWADMTDYENEMLSAFSQWSYDIEFRWQGVIYAMTCEPADMSGPLNKWKAMRTPVKRVWTINVTGRD